MSKREIKKEKKNNGVRMLPISIVLFIFLSCVALFIILNKGNIFGHSLVKIETSSASDNKTADAGEGTMEIKVEKKYLSSIKPKGEEKLIVTIDGEEVDIDDVEFESSNEDVIKIKDGKAIAVNNGKSTITAKKDKQTATVNLYVITPIQSISFTTTNSTVRVGRSLQMKLIAKPSDASVETLKYKSSDEKIATVDSSGIVTGVAPGKVTITVTDVYSEIEKSVNLTIMK